MLMCLIALPMCGKDASFPVTVASNLNGEKLTFPGGLKGDFNLLIVAFRREQQSDIDTWLKLLPSIASEHPKLAYYEVPVIDRLNPMVRWFIDNGMRRGIPDKAQRARTVTFYLDKTAFKTALGIASEDRIQLLLIDRAGKVLWRVEGPFTEESKVSLLRALPGA